MTPEVSLDLSQPVWRKAIPEARDRWQSLALVWVMVPVLCGLCVWTAQSVYQTGHHGRVWLEFVLGISASFALVAWRLKAATSLGAFCGGLICLLILMQNESFELSTVFHTGLTPLILLFILTRQATHFRRERKAALGLGESKRGRHAAQIIANLGVAGVAAAFWGLWWGVDDVSAFIAHGIRPKLMMIPSQMHLLMLAALAEATADTVSSEIGQALGGTTILITKFRKVKPGTDGAISLAGTAAGIAATAIIVASGCPALDIQYRDCVIVFFAAVLGLFFDSLLGATVERKGWIGNDLVNFASTAFAPLFLIAIAMVLRSLD